MSRRASRSDLDTVHLELPILDETAKAWLVFRGESHKDNVWLQKAIVVRGEHVSGDVWEFEIPGAVALEKGLVR